MREGGDAAVLRLTARFDATERGADGAAGRPGARPRRRWPALDPELREALELAAANVRAVAEAQLGVRGAARSSCPRARR